MICDSVQECLRRVIGLDPEAIGAGAVADSVRRRMALRDLSSESDYLFTLQSDRAELQALIESIVVPETWFFRDREPFLFLARHAQMMRPHPSRQQPMRVLSVPCSSGEEPYSIAMTLMSAGLRPQDYSIDAIDISKSLLLKAEAGSYGSNSFRGGILEDCECYFSTEGSAKRVRPELRDAIRFICGNAMQLDCLDLAGAYDVIFCRNLLIYQHEEARRQIATALHRRLKPEGLLFVGHAEMIRLLSERHEPVRPGNAFAYRRKAAS